MNIVGNPVGHIRPNWDQTDQDKPDFILGKETVENEIREAMTAAESAQTAANNAQTSANEANTAASKAQSTADSKTDLLALSITLSAGGWANNLQTVDAAGVTADKERCHVIPCTPDSANNELYYNNGLCCEDQLDGKVTFSCKEVPASDVTVNLLVLIKGVTA